MPDQIINQCDSRVILVRVLATVAINFDPTLSPEERFVCAINAAAAVLAQTVDDAAMLPEIVEDAKEIMLRAARSYRELNPRTFDQSPTAH